MSITRDARRFNAKLARMPAAVTRHVRPVMEKQAERIAATMRRFAPGWIRIDWSWGGAPAGAVALHSIGGAQELRIVIWAVGVTSEYPQGFSALARWTEFGTGGRVQKKTGRYTGRMPAQPFFYPGWRLYRKPAAAAIKRAMRKGIREALR